MNDELNFEVKGFPGAQGSKRHVGNGVMVESSKKVKPWRSDVKAAAEAAIGKREGTDDPFATISGPVQVDIYFSFARPKSHYRTGARSEELRQDVPEFVTSRSCGDLDKLCRSTFDALTAAGVINDDSQIAALITSKTYCDWGRTPGASIWINQAIR